MTAKATTADPVHEGRKRHYTDPFAAACPNSNDV